MVVTVTFHNEDPSYRGGLPPCSVERQNGMLPILWEVCRKQPASTHLEPSLVEHHGDNAGGPDHVLLSPGDGLELTAGE